MAVTSGGPHGPLARFDRVRKLDGRAVAELSAAWQVLHVIMERQDASREPATAAAETADVAGARARRARLAHQCLAGALQALDRQAPHRRALAAVDLHASTLEAWLRSQPERTPLSGRDLAAVARQWGAGRFWSWCARWFVTPRMVPFREVLGEEVQRLAPSRYRADGECLAAMADAVRHLRRSWEIARLDLDGALDRSVTASHLARGRTRLARERARLVRRMTQSIARRREWLDRELLPAVARALVRAFLLRRRPAERRPSRLDRAQWLAHWRVQAEGAVEELRTSRRLESATDALLGALEHALAIAAEEDGALNAELDRRLEVLRGDAPQPAELHTAVPWSPAAARLAEMDRVARAQADDLPEQLPVRLRATAHPVTYRSARTAKPADAFLDSYGRTVRQSCEGLFHVIETFQREIADDLQRASDVVAFATTAAEAGEAGQVIVREAVENAAALLEYRRNTPPDRRVDGMRAFAAVCRSGRETSGVVFGGPAERLAHVLRRDLAGGIPPLAALAWGSAVRPARGAGRLVLRAGRTFLMRIGWQRETEAGVPDLRVRPVLPAEYAADPSRVDLPALYRHLFRPEPVEDARFLVGRERELETIANARERWESGRFAALLVTGERGSGKTSLINCALQGPLASLPLCRGEFSQRVLTVEHLRREIARIVDAKIEDAGQGDALQAHLNSERRVIIVEEFERTFLRHVGHYDAVRMFGQMLNATAGSVFWIVALNQVAFQFLDAALGLGQAFSHRISAGTATPDEIRQAILVRHNLSGLRLRFEPPATAGGDAPDAGRRLVTGRVLRAIGIRDSAERSFFEVSARQAGGIYRTAFNIWLGHIAGIEDGLLTVKSPAPADLAAVIADLTLADLFTLVALLEHGSLTPAELATVFQQPLATSRAQIDELVAREIVAPDPGRAGYRVRPEAMSVVQEALFRRNLL